MRNRSIRSAVKTKVNKFRRAISDRADDVEEVAVAAISALDRAATKGVLHPNNTARRKSRLMKRLNAAAPAAPAPAPPPEKTSSRKKR